MAVTMPKGWAVWLQWEKAPQAAGDDSDSLKSDMRVLQADQGQYMGFVKLVARTNEPRS